MPDRICTALVCLTLDRGGAEHHILKLARALRGSRIDPLIVPLNRDADNVLRPHFEALGVPVEFPPHSRDHPGVVSWLAKLLRSGRVDVAHSFLWRPDVTLALAARLARFRRVICSERGDRVAARYWSRRWQPRRLLDRALTFSRARTLVSNSAAGAEAAVRAGCPWQKTLVIHNWVELPFIDSLKTSRLDVRRRYGLEDSIVIGFVGRLSPEKGASDFVRTAAAVAKRLRTRRTAFVMVGDGPLRPQLERQVKENGLDRQFVFAGAVEMPFSLIHAMDIGVICSPSESFPNVLLEFMACGKPVVATAVGGVADAITRGRAGRVVPFGSIEALSDACVALAEEPHMVESLGAGARRTVERNYAMTSSVNRYIQLYEHVAGGV